MERIRKDEKFFNFLRKKNPDFIVVLDTRISPLIENDIKEEWEGKCFFSSYNSNSRGVAIFTKKGFIANIVRSLSDKDGNFLALLFELEGRKILLQGIYGPNEDCPSFYNETCFKLIDEWEPDFSISVGDYNVTLDPNLDNKNYMHDNNPLARQVLKTKSTNLVLSTYGES